MSATGRKYPTWGDFLKKKRAQLYRSAREFCSKVEVGISYPQYSRYEAGDQLPNLDQALKLCRLLQIPIQEGLLEWSRAQISEEELRSEVTAFLDQVRSRKAGAVAESSSASRDAQSLFDEAGSPMSEAARSHGIFSAKSGLDQVMVFNRAHMKLFQSDKTYRDIFTYVNSFSPEWISSEEIAKAVGQNEEKVEPMLQDLSDLGVLLLAGGKCRASKRVFYYPDDPDFFDLRNENIRYNSDAVLERISHEDLKNRKAYRGLVTRELTEEQLDQVISAIERIVDRVLSLPESKNPDRIYSMGVLLGERFCRSEVVGKDVTESEPTGASAAVPAAAKEPPKRERPRPETETETTHV